MSLFKINTSFTSPIILDSSFQWVHYSASWDCLSTKDTCDAYVTMHKNAASLSSPLGFGSELLISLFNPGLRLSSTSSKNKLTLNDRTALSFSHTAGSLPYSARMLLMTRPWCYMTALSFIVRNYSKCVSYTLQTIGSTEVYCEDKKKETQRQGHSRGNYCIRKKHVCILNKLATIPF